MTTLTSPTYATPETLIYQSYKKQSDRKRRKSHNPSVIVSYPYVTNYMPSPFDPSGWYGAASDPDGTITNVTLENPSGQSFVGLVEQTGAGSFIFATNIANPEPSVLDGEKVYGAIIVKNVNIDAKLQTYIGGIGDSGNLFIDIANKTTNTAPGFNTRFTDLAGGFTLVETEYTITGDQTNVRQAWIFRDESQGIPPIGSQLYVQAVFFGKNPLAFPYAIYNQFADAGEATDYSYLGYNETISGGLLNLVSTNTDPVMIRSVNFDPSDFYILKLRVRDNIDLGGRSKSMSMFFRTDTQSYSIETRTNFGLVGAIDPWVTRVGPDEEGFYSFEIDMSQHPEWLLNGDIKGIRFDFTNAQIGTDTDVDYITLESPSKKEAYDSFFPANVMPTL